MKNNLFTSRKRLPSLLLISLLLSLLAMLPSLGAQALVVLTATLAPTTTLSQTTTPTPSPTPLPSLRDESMLPDDSLITNDPCAAPCWNGITPGETSWSNAVAILENDPSLQALRVQQGDTADALLAEWQSVGGKNCCQMITLDGETVKLIFLRLAPDRLTVGELIEAKGEPPYIVGNLYADDEAVANLIYPELSTVIYVFVASAEGEISASSEVVGSLYITPEDMDRLLQSSHLKAWEGYESYAYYDQRGFELLPVVTPTPSR